MRPRASCILYVANYKTKVDGQESGDISEKKKDRKVLTKSCTSPDLSEERRRSLGEFGEIKDF